MGTDTRSVANVRRTDGTPPTVDPPGDARNLVYDLDGIRLSVTSDLPDVLAVVDATYAAFRSAPPSATGRPPRETLEFKLICLDGSGPCQLVTPDGGSERLGSPIDGLFGLLEAMVGAVVARLYGRGILAAHAGAVAGPRGAIVIAGRSGQGKTTLVLGLVQAGQGLLSDELALLDPAGEVVRPYRRAVHVRPTTIDLLPGLAPLRARPLDELGGGSEWTVGQAEVVDLLGGQLAEAAPLGALVLLDGSPDPTVQPRIVEVSPAIAALELMRTTWAASVDFGGTLDAVGRMLAGRRCLRLSIGRFEPTVAALAERLELDG